MLELPFSQSAAILCRACLDSMIHRCSQLGLQLRMYSPTPEWNDRTVVGKHVENIWGGLSHYLQIGLFIALCSGWKSRWIDLWGFAISRWWWWWFSPVCNKSHTVSFQGPRGLRGLQGPVGAVGDRVSLNPCYISLISLSIWKPCFHVTCYEASV